MHELDTGSYLINLGSPDPEMLEKSYTALMEELQRCEKLGIELYNIHPGHHNRLIRCAHSLHQFSKMSEVYSHSRCRLQQPLLEILLHTVCMQ